MVPVIYCEYTYVHIHTYRYECVNCECICIVVYIERKCLHACMCIWIYALGHTCIHIYVGSQNCLNSKGNVEHL